MRSKPWRLAVAVYAAVIAAPSVSFAQGADSPLAKEAPSSGDAPAPAVTWQQANTEVWVHLRGWKGVLLQQTTSDGRWETVCSAPCDQRLPFAPRYRAAGGGLHESQPFTLEGSPGTHETLVVDRAGKTAFGLGIVGLVVGPTLWTVGGFFEFSLLGGDGPNPPVRDDGLALLGIGVVTFAVGLGLTIANAYPEASVSQHLDVSPAGPVPSDAWIRTPTSSAATTEPKGLQPALGIPVFSGRF